MWAWSRANITSYVFSASPVCSNEIVTQYYDLSIDFWVEAYNILIILLQLG